ncbi:MAG: MerR family transcriptional regulator [Desulfuromonas sp.]|nr:MerR family transcriptional regulator [Desulfuromonas sp.]
MNAEIPDKLFFKIGEVASITGVKPHVLRYWESEFGSFSPSKSRTQQRQYQKKDIELILQLKDLLYNQGFTIAGARKTLKAAKKNKMTSVSVKSDREHLLQLREELRDLRALFR